MVKFLCSPSIVNYIYTLPECRPLITLRSWKWGHSNFVNVTFTKPLQELSSQKKLPFLKMTFSTGKVL